jgi:hypothetical protein
LNDFYGPSVAALGTLGKPYDAIIDISPDASGNGWYFGLPSQDSSQFTQVQSAFSASADLGGKEDFYTAVLHAIGEAVGLDSSAFRYELFGHQASLGVVTPGPGPSALPLYSANYPTYPTGAGRGVLMVGSNDLSGFYDGPLPPGALQSYQGQGIDVIANDLMDYTQPVNTRELISNVDIGLVEGEFVHSETVVYPSSIGKTFLTAYNPDSHFLIVREDPGVANNDIKLTDQGRNVYVDENGLTTTYSRRSIRGVVIDTVPGTDTASVPSDLFKRSVIIAGPGHTALLVTSSRANLDYTFAPGRLSINRPLRAGLRFAAFSPKETILLGGTTGLTVVGGPGSRAIVNGTAAPTSSTLVGMRTVSIGLNGTLSNIGGAVNVVGFGLGSTDLTVDDSADRTSRSANITASSITGIAPAPITYNGPDLNSLSIMGTEAGSTYTIAGTPQNGGGNLAMTLDTGAQADTVNVMGTSSDLTVDEGKGANTLYVGMANLNGTLTAHSTGGTLSLNADDGADQTSRSGTMGINLIPISTFKPAATARPGVPRNLIRRTTPFPAQGFIPAPIARPAVPRNLIRPGTPFIPAPIVRPGVPRNLIRQTTHFYAQGFVSGLGAGQVLYDAASMTGVSVRTGELGPGGNTLVVQQTFFSQSAARATTITMGGHNDVTDVEGTSGPLAVNGVPGGGGTVDVGFSAQRLDLIHGPLSISNSGLVLENQQAAGDESVLVGANSLSLSNSTAVSYTALSGLTYHGNAGNDTYGILGSPGRNVAVYAGAGNDTIAVAGPSIPLDGFGNISLFGGGGNDSATIHDGSPTAALVYNLQSQGPAAGTQTLVQRTGGISIAVNQIGDVTLDTGNGGDTVNLKGVAPGTSLAVNGGAGNDRFSIQGLAQGSPISVDGGGGVNTLDYSSYGGPTSGPGSGPTSGPGTPPSGIQAWYKAEGNANDSIGKNNGTAVGVTYGPGEVGQAFQFAGNGEVRVPDSPSLDTPQVTVEAWVKSAVASPTAEVNYKNLVAKGIGTYGLYTYADGGLAFYISDGENAPFISPDAGPGIWDGQWHHVAATYDGSAVRLYADGKQVGNGTPASVTINYNLPGTHDLQVGNISQFAGSDGFDGSIDELSIYNRALSASEIQAIFNAGSAGKSGAPAPGPGATTQGVVVDLPLGTATGLAGGISNIQNLVGSPGNDILVGNGGNTINGLGGRDLMIAGPSASALEGTGGDILIGGPSSIDGNLAALEAVLATWSNPDMGFPDRVSTLLGGILASSKVRSNKAHNSLAGGNGPNLFFASTGDTTNKTNADSSVTIS